MGFESFRVELRGERLSSAKMDELVTADWPTREVRS